MTWFFKWLLCTVIVFVPFLSLAEGPEYWLKPAFGSLRFTQPVGIYFAPGLSKSPFVVERRGKVYQVLPQKSGFKKRLFLDLENQIDSSGLEMGLLGLSFHPNYSHNRLIYLNYTKGSPLRTVVSSFRVKGGKVKVVDLKSEQVLFTVNQPFRNHNGGMMAFGPDGYLYIGLGDGGYRGDSLNHAQNKHTRFGALLRIDVNKRDNNLHYAIPPNNPFYQNQKGYHEEIFAYGFRNPWRFSFDRKTGTLWLADVGQDKYEEINVIQNGGNYGWPWMEGAVRFRKRGRAPKELIPPVWTYGRKEGVSVTGGYVYRGSQLSSLVGRYIYGDFGSGSIWALRLLQNGKVLNEKILETDLQISSFGEGPDGELYVVDFSGDIFLLAALSLK